jgi:hypothetical protein
MENIDQLESELASLEERKTTLTRRIRQVASAKKNFPETVRVSGMPFMLQGWNGVYEWTGTMSNDAPVYRLPWHVLFRLIDIIGVQLQKDENGVWKLWRDCDPGPLHELKKNGHDQGISPCGDWTMGVRVSHTDDKSSHFPFAKLALFIACVASAVIAWKLLH